MLNQKFKVNVENNFSEVSSISCGVPQGLILGLLLFFIYVNDMPIAVKCNLVLYADGACLVFKSRNVKDIEKQLIKIFQTYAISLLRINKYSLRGR